MNMKSVCYALVMMAMLELCVGCKHSEGAEHGETDEHHEHTGIVLEPEQASMFGIEYETVIPGKFQNVIKTSGRIQASGSDIYSVTAKKSGIITLAPGVLQGMDVASGERLGTITSEGVQGGDVSQAAHANLQAAKAEYERLKPLYEDKLITASAFREAERAYNEARALAGHSSTAATSTSVTSPGAGVLQSLYVKSGDYVEVGSPIAVVAKNSNQVLIADLPARLASQLPEIVSANFIPEGGSTLIKLEENGGRKISQSESGTVTNGYIPVYFNFMGNSLSSPGGFAEVYLLAQEKENVISLPVDGIIEVQGNKYAYVQIDDEEYEKRLIVTGNSNGERVEIIRGLQEGDRVVSKGASIIRMAEVSSVAPPAHTHNH